MDGDQSPKRRREIACFTTVFGHLTVLKTVVVQTCLLALEIFTTGEKLLTFVESLRGTPL
jgi:hypothetical protein